MKKNTLFYLIAVVSTLLFALLQVRRPDVVQEHIESKTYDLRLLLRDRIRKPAVPDNIVIVAIDEKSIKDIGRWPWSREVMADLIERISVHRPKVIGVDIMFTEPESPEGDRRLGRAIREAGNVVLAAPFDVPLGIRKDKTVPEPPDYVSDHAFMEVRSQKGINWKKEAIEADGLTPPLEGLARGAVLGHVYSHADLDGTTRLEILYLKYGDDCYPSLPLQIARLASGIDQKDTAVYGGAGIKLGASFIPTDLHGRAMINYRGREQTFPYVSASDVIKGRVDASLLKDRIILIGTSALATYDQKITPLSANTPGVEKNATVVSNVIGNDFIRPSPGVIELVVIFLTGILGLVLPRLKALPGSFVAASLILLYTLAACGLLVYRGFLISLVYPVLNMILIFGFQTVMRFFYEERSTKEIRRIFSSYVSPKIVKELIEHPEKANLGGERKLVTILFSDIIGFTTLSEKKRPEDVVAILNEYFGEMAGIIFRWEGTLDKFVGDEIMVFWGAPVDQPDHAERALCCALEMSARLDAMRRDWAERGLEGLDCGIGINTGEVVIGNIGAQGKKMDYTAIGDHVNLAARVEKLTRDYGTRILITENTASAVEGARAQGALKNAVFTPLGSVRVKGKENEVRIFGCR